MYGCINNSEKSHRIQKPDTEDIGTICSTSRNIIANQKYTYNLLLMKKKLEDIQTKLMPNSRW